MRFNSSSGESSALFSDKKPDASIDFSKRRIAQIKGRTNYHHAFCYKFLDDDAKVIDKPIYSKYDEKKETEVTINIGKFEKLVGFRVQLSSWVDCKISKIWFKIAKMDSDQSEEKTKQSELSDQKQRF